MWHSSFTKSLGTHVSKIKLANIHAGFRPGAIPSRLVEFQIDIDHVSSNGMQNILLSAALLFCSLLWVQCGVMLAR
jgi:hypothetical protein